MPSAVRQRHLKLGTPLMDTILIINTWVIHIPVCVWQLLPTWLTPFSHLRHTLKDSLRPRAEVDLLYNSNVLFKFLNKKNKPHHDLRVIKSRMESAWTTDITRCAPSWKQAGRQTSVYLLLSELHVGLTLCCPGASGLPVKSQIPPQVNQWLLQGVFNTSGGWASLSIIILICWKDSIFIFYIDI